MSHSDHPFTEDDLAELCGVVREVVEEWHANGVAPACFEQRSAEGVRRFYSAAAIQEFVSRHRVMRTAEGGRKRAEVDSRPIGAPLAGGGVFTSDKPR